MILKRIALSCNSSKYEFYIRELKQAFKLLNVHRFFGMEKEWIYSFTRVLVPEREDIPPFSFRQNDLVHRTFPDTEAFVDKYSLDLTDNMNFDTCPGIKDQNLTMEKFLSILSFFTFISLLATEKKSEVEF